MANDRGLDGCGGAGLFLGVSDNTGIPERATKISKLMSLAHTGFHPREEHLDFFKKIKTPGSETVISRWARMRSPEAAKNDEPEKDPKDPLHDILTAQDLALKGLAEGRPGAVILGDLSASISSWQAMRRRRAPEQNPRWGLVVAEILEKYGIEADQNLENVDDGILGWIELVARADDDDYILGIVTSEHEIPEF